MHSEHTSILLNTLSIAVTHLFNNLDTAVRQSLDPSERDKSREMQEVNLSDNRCNITHLQYPPPCHLIIKYTHTASQKVNSTLMSDTGRTQRKELVA